MIEIYDGSFIIVYVNRFFIRVVYVRVYFDCIYRIGIGMYGKYGK